MYFRRFVHFAHFSTIGVKNNVLYVYPVREHFIPLCLLFN